MPRRQPYSSASETEATIRRLRDDLYLARETIIELMGPEARQILTSHYRCSSRQEGWHWAEAAALEIADLCHPVTQQTYQGHPVGSPRANCPLCGEGSQAFYEHQMGFAIPEGLLRHLLGTHNSRQCGVFGAAQAMARDRFRREFPED